MDFMYMCDTTRGLAEIFVCAHVFVPGHKHTYSTSGAHRTSDSSLSILRRAPQVLCISAV